jgi:hypothetical protein
LKETLSMNVFLLLGMIFMTDTEETFLYIDIESVALTY